MRRPWPRYAKPRPLLSSSSRSISASWNSSSALLTRKLAARSIRQSPNRHPVRARSDSSDEIGGFNRRNAKGPAGFPARPLGRSWNRRSKRLASAPQPKPSAAPRSAALSGLDLGGPRLGLGVERRHGDRAATIALDQLRPAGDVADLEVRLRRVRRQAIQGAGLTRLSRDRQLGRGRRRRVRHRPPAEARTGCRQTGAGERQQNPREGCRPPARRGLRVRQHGRLLWPVRL